MRLGLRQIKRRALRESASHSSPPRHPRDPIMGQYCHPSRQRPSIAVGVVGAATAKAGIMKRQKLDMPDFDGTKRERNSAALGPRPAHFAADLPPKGEVKPRAWPISSRIAERWHFPPPAAGWPPQQGLPKADPSPDTPAGAGAGRRNGSYRGLPRVLRGRLSALAMDSFRLFC